MSACVDSSWMLSFPVFVTGLLCLGIMLLGYWVLHQRGFPGRDSFVLLHVASVWWLLAAGAEMASQAAGCKVFWASMAWPGIVGVPTFWAVFLWQYVNSVRSGLAWRSILALSIAPLLIWALAMTNAWHGLLYSAGTAPVSAEPGAAIRYEHGLLFYTAAIYGYLLMVYCFMLTLRAALAAQGVYRRHYLAFALVTCIPWAANLGYVLFDWTLFGFDPTPFSFVVTLVAFAWLIVGVRLFDLLPVARHLLLEELFDPVLVVDPQSRVIEANPAALQLAGLGTDWQGRPLGDWPVFGADVLAVLQGSTSTEEQLLALAGSTRYFELRIRNIERATRTGSYILGRMIYLRDVTQRHLSELKLAEALAVSEERLRTISQLHEQLQDQALRDPLTKLYNRRYLDEFFARELARCQRECVPISLALIDLDHFKRLNDEHGHLTGDDVLRAVAARLGSSLRSSDAVFRIGGEEFLLILPGADSIEAHKRMSSICEELAKTPVETRSGLLRVTLSAGLSHWPAQGLALDVLLQTADAALYEAKRSGRNQVCAAIPASS
ncbi:diguanylate cyclase [Pseudomonas sp. LS44]|uniref:histidine kinase N-terminal 7TM domain-containing diguanylate cyclase n=1 Tax=Pseudomonas sp. LS44 TaxID=1357074 RepID=UPI00215A5F56|nr:histidine kinase N-terminal 7TM domain-containing protein [Pseudomonas sp. LS44]UVE19657.1 diguanylate cyclase [Pseudomonas sp. LS44]